MAAWFSSVKEAVTNAVCRTFWSDPPHNSSSTSLDAHEELQVFASGCQGPSGTVVSLDDSTDDSSSSSDGVAHPSPRVGNKQQDSPQDNDSSYKGQPRLHCTTCADIPIRTKGAQGVIVDSELCIGGGYVVNSKQASVIHKFNPVFELWDSLPACPVKLFGMAVFNHKLVLVGGKEVGNLGSNATNKIITWNKDSWSHSLPPMTFARLSPVVISCSQFLIVAGGKGSLDYNLEIYDSASKRWSNAPPLPTKCFSHTSAVSGSTWYLLNQENGSILYANTAALIQQATGLSVPGTEHQSEDRSEKQDWRRQAGSSSSLWLSLPSPPFKPAQIMTISSHLLAICENTNPIKVSAFFYNKESGSWCLLNKLPNLSASSSALPDDKGGLYLFGGEGGAEQYSNKLYLVTMRNSADGHGNSKAKNMKPPITFRFK